MKRIDELTALVHGGSGVCETLVPDGWQQGRGAHGGLVIGLLARATEMLSSATPRPRMRALSVQLAGAVVPGRAELHAESIREGSQASFASSRLMQDGEVRASALVVRGGTRSGGQRRPAPPDFSSWREVPAIDVAAAGGPAFAVHYEYRPVIPPCAGRDDGLAGGFIRPTVAPARWDDVLVAMLADAWWPAWWSTTRRLVPMGTIAWDVHLIEPADDIDPSLPLRSWGRCDAAYDGYVSETRSLWAHDDRLLAISHQTFALLG